MTTTRTASRSWSAAAERYNASLILDQNLAAGRGDKLAIRTPDAVDLTYAQLAAQVARAGNLLKDLGVQPEQRVLLVLDDTPAFPAAFLGAIRIGAVPVPVNPLDKAEHFRHYLRDSEARVAIAEASLMPAIVDARGDGQALLIVANGEAEGALPLEEAMAELPAELDPVDTHRDDPAFWLYSSGSTGLPKGVVHLHHDIAYTCDTYAREILQISEGDVTFSTTKLFHAYGLGNGLSFPYSVGATTVLASGRNTPARALELAVNFKPTLFFSVPALYRGMLDQPAVDLSSVRMCVSAAEPLHASIEERWEERYGVPIVDGIGSTEMLHIYCSNRFGDVRRGTSGRPVQGYEMKLLDLDGKAPPDGESGQLFVRGDSCAAYYWRQHEKTKRCMVGEWFATGDRYRVDADGYYVYEGRMDDMLKIGGLWVSPTDMETALMQHPGVTEAVVIGVEMDEVSRIKAFVVAADGEDDGDALADALRAWCKERLRRYEYPHFVEFVDDLPRTVTGKVQRFKLREREASR
ncbi:MAG TPA: benzoate-CoA ligase family protein [Thermoleophilaceae bacterium]